MSFRIDQLAVYNLATVGGSITAGSFVKSGGTSSQFLKADGSIDSNSYVTGGPFLPLSGGTVTGTVVITSSTDGPLTLRVPSGDPNQWNYINFNGTDNVRDAYFGTDGSGNPTWYRDDNNLNVKLNSTFDVNGGGLTLTAADADVRVNRGRFQVYNNAGTGNLGYRIRTDDNGGWRWQFVDGGNNEYFGVAYTSGNISVIGTITTSVSSGTMISHGSMSDAFGYNGSYGTYIGSLVGGTYYIYANGRFYDNGTVRVLLHSSNYGSYALPLSGGTLTGDLRFNQGAGYGRIAFADNYHGMILRGIPNNAAGDVTVGDYTSLIQHSGDFRFYRTNGSINELYFQVNASAAYWRGNTIIHSGTIGSQSVAYASNADTVDGYHMNQNVLTTSSPTFANLTLDGSVNAYGLRFRNGTAITYCGFGGGELNNIFHTESAYGNLRHNDISNYEVSADGSSWSAGTLTADIYNLFLGERDKGGSLTIAASGVGRYQRFTFAIGYKNFDMLHITGSTNGEAIYIKLETSTDGGSSYSENFTSIWNSWPGNHSKVWSIFNSAITRIRLTIYKPGNNYGNSAGINSINYYGGYSGYNERYHMQVYSYDYQSASITRNTFIGGALTVYSNETISGSGYGLYFTGGNNRIYFGGNRAIEGNGTNLQIGEGHSQTQIQSATTQVDGNIVMAKGSDPRIYSNTNVGLNIDGQGLYLNRYVGSDISMVFGGGNVMIGPYTGPSFALHVKKNQNQVAGFESPNANTWIDLISTAGTWSMGATGSNTWAIYQRGVANAIRFEVGASSASLYGNTVWHSGNLTNLNQLTNGPGYLTSLGFSYSTGVNANHVVQRDANGYIYANYINFNTSESENPTISSFFTSNGDGWSRKSSLAHVKNSIRGVADGTWGINVSGTATNAVYLGTHDLRSIAPNSHDAYKLRFGFTSWANNNTAPWADYLHLRSYSDSSGGSDNLVMFLKSGIGMRIWQQSFGSGSTYSSYVDVLHSSNYNSYSPTLTGGGASGTWGISISGNAASANLASQVTINYNNDSNSTYQMLWGSGNSVYGTSLIYCNPSTDTIYSRALRGSDNVSGTGEATYHPAGIYSTGTNWLYGTMYMNNNAIRDVQEVYNNGWFRTVNHQGLYNPTNDAHFYPNNASYGSWRIDGTRNGWHGIHFNSGATLMMNANETGVHKEAVGWQWRWENGIFYVHQAGGGGNGNVVLHAGNYTSYAPSTTGSGASGTWGINISGSASQLGGFTLQNVVPFHSGSDFVDGTLVVTNINAAVTYGDSFVMEVTGKSYGSGPAPFALLLEGYIYADTFINVGAISYGSWFPGPIKILNYSGNLAFWWPRGSYWNSFSVRVRDAGGGSSNRVTSVGNSTEPASAKKVSVSVIQSLNSNNYNSYAPTLTGGGASGTWGINITGNAGSASSVAWGNVSSKPASWLNNTNLIEDRAPSETAFPSGFYQNSGGGAGNPVGTWFNFINVRHSNPGNGHGYQIGMSYYDNNLWFRSYQGGTSPSFASWSRALGTNTDPYPSNMNQYVRTTDAVTFGGATINYSGSNVTAIGVTHTGSISSGQIAQGLAIGWSGYGASFAIVYKQGELSPSDMCHIYNVGGFYMKIFDGSSNRFHRWDDNGTVSINSSSQGSYTFNVTGDIYATADVIAFSDARVKDDVRTVENALDKVTKLRGVTYIKKDEDNKKRKMGVIAQEVLEVLPEVVHEDNDGYYGVSYGNIVGVLIEAIKEQQKQIDELKQELKNK